MAGGKPCHLEEKGELAEINASLNQASAFLQKKTAPVPSGSGECLMISVHLYL